MNRPAISTLFLLLLVCLTLVLFGSGAVAEAAGKTSFKSAKSCQPCHQAIYRNWRQSLHALSFTDAIFTTAYRKAYTDTGGAAKEYCLTCHAPVAKFIGDSEAYDPISREGVTCDFCHSVTGVDPGHPSKPFTVDPAGPARAASDRGGDPYGHKAVKSDIVATSKLCSGCHDFKNRHGVHVGATYTEWKKSPFAKEGVECHDCHMKELAAGTVNDPARFADHSLGRDLASLSNAVTLTIKKSVRQTGATGEKESTYVEVEMTNARIGHYAPTGTPMRQLALEVKTLDASGQVIESQKKLYGKTITGENGQELFSDGEVFLHGKKVAEDTRLAPGEKRTVKFLFKRRTRSVRSVEADVYFVYRPEVAQTTEMRIPLSGADNPAP